MEIVIHDKEKAVQKSSLQYKKPYLQFEMLENQGFIFYDRYRFMQQQPLPADLQKLRKSDSLIYIKVQKPLILMVTQTFKMSVFNLIKGQFMKSSIALPKDMIEKMRVPTFESGLLNQWKQGKPKYQALNSGLQSWELEWLEDDKIILIDTESGVTLWSLKTLQKISQVTSSQNYLAVNVKTTEETVNVQAMKIERITSMNRQRILIEHVRFVKDDPSKQTVNHYHFYLDQEFIAQQCSKIDFLKNYFLQPEQNSVAIGLNQGSEKYQLFMITKRATVVNLITRISQELMQSTRNSQIDDMRWAQEMGLLAVSMTNGNILCFNNEGDQVKLLSEKLYLSSIVANRQLFISTDFVCNYINSPADESYRQVNRAIITGNQLYIFNGFQYYSYNITVKSTMKKKKQKCVIQAYQDFPLITYTNCIRMDDQLFLSPSKVYVNFLMSLKANNDAFTHQSQKQIAAQGCNSILYFLHVNQPVLAFNTLKLLKEHFKNNILHDGYKFAILLKQLQRVRRLGKRALPDSGSNDNAMKPEREGRLRKEIQTVIKWIVNSNNEKPQRQQQASQMKVVAGKIIQHIKRGIEVDKEEVKYRYQQYKRQNLIRLSDDAYHQIISILLNEKHDNLRLRLLLTHIKLFLGQVKQDKILTKEQVTILTIMMEIQAQARPDQQSIMVQLPSYDNFVKKGILAGKLYPQVFFIPKEIRKNMTDPLVKFSFFIIMNQQQKFVITLKEDIAKLSLCDFMYLAKQYQELKQANFNLKINTSLDRFDFFLPLLHKIVSAKHYLSSKVVKQHLASLMLLFNWNIIDPSHSQIASHICNLLYLTPYEQTSILKQPQLQLTQYPRFLIFFLQNLNKLTLPQFQTSKLPQNLPFRSLHPKMLGFLIDSFVMMNATFGTAFEIHLSTVENAPNIEIALAQMVKFGELEERLNTLMQTNQMSAREKLKSDQALIDSKVQVWKMFLLLWYVQCSFQNSNSVNHMKYNDVHLRVYYLAKILGLPNNDQIPSNVKGKNLLSLKEVYNVEDDNDRNVVRYIGRLLLDEQFVKFVMKMPKLISIYQSKHLVNGLIESEYELQVGIQRTLKEQYDNFKSIYGLKLNYTLIKNEDGQICYAKRVKKLQWFKPIIEPLPITSKYNQPLLSHTPSLNISLDDSAQVSSIAAGGVSNDHSFNVEHEDLLSKSFNATANQSMISQSHPKLHEENLPQEEEIKENEKSLLREIDYSEKLKNLKLNKENQNVPIQNHSIEDSYDLNDRVDTLLLKESASSDFKQPLTKSQFAVKDKLPSSLQSTTKQQVLNEQKNQSSTYHYQNERVIQGIQILQKILWKKCTQSKYQVLYAIKLNEQLQKSQENASKHRSRSSIPTNNNVTTDLTNQDLVTTINSDEKVGAQRYSDQGSSDNQNNSNSRNSSHQQRYLTPPNHYHQFYTYRGRGRSQQRRFSPEDHEGKFVGKRLDNRLVEYSPVILDDTEDTEQQQTTTLTLDQSIIQNNEKRSYEEQRSTSNMDTSRFGDNYFSNIVNQTQDVQNNQEKHQRRQSILSHLIDPFEHAKSLKSPLRDRLVSYMSNHSNERSASYSSNSQERRRSQRRSRMKAVAQQIVIERSPVHFGEPSKHWKLNKMLSNTLLRQNEPFLLGESTKPKAIRILRVNDNKNTKEREISPVPLKFLALKQQLEKPLINREAKGGLEGFVIAKLGAKAEDKLSVARFALLRMQNKRRTTMKQ